VCYLSPVAKNTCHDQFLETTRDAVRARINWSGFISAGFDPACLLFARVTPQLYLHRKTQSARSMTPRSRTLSAFGTTLGRTWSNCRKSIT